MKLDRLASVLKITLPDADAQKDIRTLTQHTREATEGSLFVCIRGARADGHLLAADAYRTGCRAFVAERELSLPSDATVLYVADTRAALGVLAVRFFGSPSLRLSLIGITGTKGKTTTALMLRTILEAAGIPTGYIGTNGIFFGDTALPSPNSTPDPITLQRSLSRMLAQGAKAAVIEVSSQGMLQNRVDGCCFDALLFTNLYPDHIGPGEHADLAEYVACKHRLFTDFPARIAVLNADAPVAKQMEKSCRAERILHTSQKHAADATAKDATPWRGERALGMQFIYRSASGAEQTVRLPLLGTQNVENALLAMAVAEVGYGVSPATAAKALEALSIDGRSETIPLGDGAFAVIDYAHNGESLSRLLSALCVYKPSRLTVLFGSVGERTQMRRYELGRAAAEGADLAILTSDNPGTEDPDAIINEIATAFAGTDTPHVRIADRATAIHYAVEHRIPNEILVLAGKGQENYQLIGTEKVPFSDRAELLAALSATTANV